MYRVIYERRVATKDIPNLKSANLLKQFFKELDAVKSNPFVGKQQKIPLKGKRTVRINQQHRIFYTIDTNIIIIDDVAYEGTITILQAFGHDYQ